MAGHPAGGDGIRTIARAVFARQPAGDPSRARTEQAVERIGLVIDDGGPPAGRGIETPVAVDVHEDRVREGEGREARKRLRITPFGRPLTSTVTNASAAKARGRAAEVPASIGARWTSSPFT